MKVGERKNEFGTTVSVHCCIGCECEYTVCPAVPDGVSFGGYRRVEIAIAHLGIAVDEWRVIYRDWVAWLDTHRTRELALIGESGDDE